MRGLLVVAALLALAGCRGCKSSSSADAGVRPGLSDSGPEEAWLTGVPRLVPPDSGPLTVDGGTLVVRAMSEPAGLNFLDDAFRDGWTSRITRNLVFESLLEISAADYTLKPQLAEKYEVDQTVQTFHLRPGVKFHDGASFTAKDVIATLDAVMDPKRPTASVRADFSELDSYKAVDELTVQLKWKRLNPFALRQLAKLPIYPHAALAGDWAAFSRKPIGTGPYAVDSWESGQSVTLKRTGTWWGGLPPLDTLRFRFVKDHTVAAAMAEKGEFDLMTTVQPVLWRMLESADPKNAWAQSGYQRLRSPDNSYSYIAWNEALPFFAEPKVRRALAHAWPSEEISRAVDLGLELPTTCPFFIAGDKCDTGVKPLEYSPELAKAELADSGWRDTNDDGLLDRNGGTLRFRFLMPATSVRLGKIVPLYQAELARIGITLEPEKVEGAVLSARLAKRDFEVVSRVWTEFDTEQDLFQVFHSSQVDGGSNFAGFQDKEVDEVLTRIRGEMDPSQRRALERELHRMLYAQQPYLFMTARQSLDLAKNRVHGLVPSVVWYDLRQVWVSP